MSTYGLTADGLKIPRLEDLIAKKNEQAKELFGENLDVSPKTPEGQFIALNAKTEADLWELIQSVYNAINPKHAEGKQLDNTVALTGTTRLGAQFSVVDSGVARGLENTVIPVGTIISVQGDSTSRFLTQDIVTIDIVDGSTFKSGPIKLQAEIVGPISANAGTLNVIETPVIGLDSFTNESDAQAGSDVERDDELKVRRDEDLEKAGAGTLEAIRSELNARPNVNKVIVFQNNSAIVDNEGRPPTTLDIIIDGDTEPELASAIFLVIGAGIGMVGDITQIVVDSEGFEQTIKFSRPTDVPVYITANITKDSNTYPIDGDDQVKEAFRLYGSVLEIGQDIIVFGSKSLVCAINDITGILDIELLVGKAPSPTESDNIVIASRERASIDTGNIIVNS